MICARLARTPGRLSRDRSLRLLLDGRHASHILGGNPQLLPLDQGDVLARLAQQYHTATHMPTMMKRRALLLQVVSTFATSTLAAPACSPSLAAQETFATNTGPASGRGSIGGNLLVAVPRGDFARYTDNGFGGGAYLLGALDKNAVLHIRAEASFVSYGNSLRTTPLSGTGGLVRFDLRTSSNIASALIGPQLLGAKGIFSPYATVLGGFSVFWTETTVEGSQTLNLPFASTTNASDVVWAYGGAVGSYLRVRQGPYRVRIDLGARLLRHDQVRYLTADRVTDAFTTGTLVPVRGRADFVSYYLGANVPVF